MSPTSMCKFKRIKGSEVLLHHYKSLIWLLSLIYFVFLVDGKEYYTDLTQAEAELSWDKEWSIQQRIIGNQSYINIFW